MQGVWVSGQEVDWLLRSFGLLRQEVNWLGGFLLLWGWHEHGVLQQWLSWSFCVKWVDFLGTFCWTGLQEHGMDWFAITQVNSQYSETGFVENTHMRQGKYLNGRNA